MKFNIICASHSDQVLNKNLGTSHFYKNSHKTTIKGYSNIAEAYNTANKLCEQYEYNVFSHHDVYMPPQFEDQLKNSILEVNALDNNWGVLGVAGVRLENDQRKFYGHLKDRGMETGRINNLPHGVQTLDELLLITKGDFIFDEQFDLHFYGADICMEAIKQGRKNYAISAYVYHNSTLTLGFRSQSFRDCEERFKNKWKDWLPIVTCCTIIK